MGEIRESFELRLVSQPVKQVSYHKSSQRVGNLSSRHKCLRTRGFLRRMAACTLHHDAYCVAYLHICRYNSKAVNGVLVGSVDGDSVIVRKAFPLFHAAGALGLAPMLEAALMLVRRI